jgi:hypothetical protein
MGFGRFWSKHIEKEHKEAIGRRSMDQEDFLDKED